MKMMMTITEQNKAVSSMRMTMTKPTDELQRDPRIPKDLTKWIESFTLVRLTLEAVEVGFAESTPDFRTAKGGYRPKMLLTLLTYAYACGIYGSRDIELAIPHTKALRYLCSGHRPDANTLRQSRKQNRQWLQRTLAELLQRAWNMQFPVGGQTDSYLACSFDRWQHTPPPFAGEAEARLRLAIMAATLQWDE
jgi:transposase